MPTYSYDYMPGGRLYQPPKKEVETSARRPASQPSRTAANPINPFPTPARYNPVIYPQQTMANQPMYGPANPNIAKVTANTQKPMQSRYTGQQSLEKNRDRLQQAKQAAAKEQDRINNPPLSQRIMDAIWNFYNTQYYQPLQNFINASTPEETYALPYYMPGMTGSGYNPEMLFNWGHPPSFLYYGQPEYFPLYPDLNRGE